MAERRVVSFWIYAEDDSDYDRVIEKLSFDLEVLAYNGVIIDWGNHE